MWTSRLSIVKRAKILLYPNQHHQAALEELKALVMVNMLKDDIIKVVSQDEVILTYRSFMLTSYGIRKASSISQRMRILARLLILLRSKENTNRITLIDVLIPEYFDMIVECAKELGTFSLKTKEGENEPYFEKPSLPLKIGYTLEKCCSLKRSMGIK